MRDPVLWLVAGSLTLVVLAFPIAQRDALQIGLLDLVSWAVVMAMIALRLVDIVFSGLQPAGCEHATTATWSGYAQLVLARCGGAWFKARALAAAGWPR